MRQYNASQIKNMNRMQVYNIIKDLGQTTRSEIGKYSGVSAPTVLKITNFLEEENMILPAGEANTSAGRKPQIFKINPDYLYVIGAYYEGEYIKIGLVDASGQIISTTTLKVSEYDFDHVIGEIIPKTSEQLIMASNIDKEKIIGIGIGLPGAINPEKNTITYAPLVGIYEEYDMSEILEKTESKLNIPVYFSNDVNSAAIGEYLYRNDNEELIYISLGTGLGCGIIVDGKPYLGNNYRAGEIGYMVSDNEFKGSKSAPGYMESITNLKVLNDKFPGFEDSSISKEDFNNALEYTADKLSQIVVNIISILDIDLIVIGGIVVERFGDEIIPPIKNRVKELSLFEANIEFCKCPVPTILGVAMTAIDKKFEEIFEIA